jgi:hypothetical protein
MLPPLRYFLSLAALTAILSTASAQTPSGPPKLPPHFSPPPELADQEQIVAYWTTETGWKSELQLRNNQVGQDLTVTPVLRIADGAETPLAPVAIKPQEVQAIDLDAAIGTTAPQLVGTYGSLVLRYRSPSSGNLYAALMLRSIGHPVAFHIDATGELQERQAGGREGIWWLPKDTTSDYLILTNDGQNTISADLSLYDSNGKEAKQRILLAPRETTRFSVRKLVLAAGLTGSYGGIKVFTSAHAGSLDTLHFLFDETAGFSAILKMFDHDPNARLEERDYARTAVWTLHAPMLALSNPDPALAFPPGTKLQPQLFIRNATGKPVDAALRFNWRAGSSTGKASAPALRLNPYETRRVDVSALQDGNTLPKEANWASVTLTTKGLPDEVMAVAASYDPSLHYGAQTPFSDQLAFHWAGSMWEYDPQHDSIITAGNGGTKPTRAALTLYYNQGTQRYELEQTLQPDEQMWIDIGKLIREHLPDKNGNTLPENLTSGSFEWQDLTNKGIGTLFEGKVIYDKTYGHVAYGCGVCCGYKSGSVLVWYDPLGVPLSLYGNDGVNATDSCSLQIQDVSDSFYGYWAAANTAIATVDNYGTHHGASVGSTTSSTYGQLQMYYRSWSCPIRADSPGGGVNVMKLSCSSATRGSSTTCSVTNAPTGATFSNWSFKDSNNNTVTSNTTNSSWAGKMVTGGTISVKVTASSGLTTLSASVTVTNRSGFAFAAVTATSEPNGFSTAACGTLSVASPPQPGLELGLFCLQQVYSFNSQSINDGGPNQGYKYITSISNSNGNTSTASYYVVSPDAADPNSTFSKAQCGNYNASTNPNGFISQLHLITNIIRHESGNMNSHYAQYVAAQNNSANNLGTVAEQIVGLPSDTNFSTTANDVLNPKLSLIGSSAQSPEPCSANYDGSVTPCVYQGGVNYIPYVACN